MDPNWLNNLDQNTAVIVPTRSLVNSLNEQIAADNIAREKTVWEAPNILVWQDYLNHLWQLNRDHISQHKGVHTLISNQQSLLLWVQVIESSRRQEKQLALLNVQQTARAVQRSWALMCDWQIGVDTLRQDHVADLDQFIRWLEAYKALLAERGLLDTPTLVHYLSSDEVARETHAPFKKLIWHDYDLVTAAQRQINQRAEQQGVMLTVTQSAKARSGHLRYVMYQDTQSEIKSALQQARELIEGGSESINIVIPDLQRRQTQVSEIARDVFYPSMSPLEVQRNQTVYRFSLGQPLNQWAAIETALRLIVLLKNRTSVTDLSFLLRNQFIAVSHELRSECRLFERWLKRQRVRNLSVDSLPELYQQCLDHLQIRDQAPDTPHLGERLLQLANQRQQLQELLAQRKTSNGFAALSFSDWLAVFTDWLQAWGWHAGVASQQLDSVQFQLYKRWINLLEEFASLAAVQKQVGLNRALEVLQQMTRDAVFLPKAAASPIFISGIYEAIGRPADTCFLIGMTQDYPSPPTLDSFLPNRLLKDAGYAEATADGAYTQAEKVIQSLLSSASNKIISYAQRSNIDAEIINHVSPLYRREVFQDATRDKPEHPQFELECYQDTQGPAWRDAGRATGGSRIFEDQSNCGFKAFVTHQLGFLRHDESEFGLDALDRGNLVHRMLERLWEVLDNQANLKAMPPDQLAQLIEKIVDEVSLDPTLGLSKDKQVLVQHEKPRHIALLTKWLAYEAKRPIGFSVIEREESRIGEVAGIRFKYIIDRLDMTDDGRTLIIDYKTGEMARRDWFGDRIRSPQLPLYATTLDKAKRKPVAGIAFAKVNTKPEFVELSESGIFRDNFHALRYEQYWQESRAEWLATFEMLAKDFLAGNAKVNPIDDDTCRYCELKPVCRVSQLKHADQQPPANV